MDTMSDSYYPPYSYDHDMVGQVRAGLATKKMQAEYNRDPQLWAKDKLGVHLWSVQKEIIESVRDNKRTTVASCHGSGKALTLDTPIPVPYRSDSDYTEHTFGDEGTGMHYVPMQDIQAGDLVYDEHQLPVKVIAVTDPHEYQSTDVYFLRSTATEGLVEHSQVLTASLEHQWNVLTPQEQARIKVLCRRRGISNPDWSYWHHRATTMTTSKLRPLISNAQTGDYYIVPGARFYTSALNSGYSDMASRINYLLAEYGTVDINGRLCMRMSSSINSRRTPTAMERAIKGIRGVGYPEPLLEFETALQLAGYKVNATRRRKGNTYVYELAIHDDPHVLLQMASALGRHDDQMSDLDVQAIIMQKADERAKDHAGNPAPREHVGGWFMTGTSYVRNETVKCIEVDSDTHLYLAGKKGVPTHNSMIASVAATWWIDSHPPGTAIVMSTAPTYAQVHAILWEEIRKHLIRAKQRGKPLPGTVTMADNWNLEDGTLAGQGRKPKDGDNHAFQGIHRRFVLCIIDEACGVPAELWTGAEAITTNEGCAILVIGNPDDRDTDFGKSFEDPSVAHMWNRIRIPASITPNLTGEPVPPLLNEVLVSKQWCDDARDRWGEDDPRYISKVLAKFPEANEASLFSPAVIATGFEESDRELELPPYIINFGVDCARYGGDLNTLTMYDGLKVRVIDSWGGMDTVSTAMKVLRLIGDEITTYRVKWRDMPQLVIKADIRVDAVGLGAGVVDTLAAQRAELEQELQRIGSDAEPWYTVREMQGSAAPPKDVGGSIQGYGNARAYWYDQSKHLMRANAIDIEDHAKLKDELAGIRYKYKNGKLYIESKEEMRERGVKSPDYADSFVYAVAPVHDGLVKGDTVSTEAQEVVTDDDLAMMVENRIAPY